MKNCRNCGANEYKGNKCKYCNSSNEFVEWGKYPEKMMRTSTILHLLSSGVIIKNPYKNTVSSLLTKLQ